MKAKDLAEILLQNPDAEVVFAEYNGGDSPLTSVESANFIPAETVYFNPESDYVAQDYTTTDIIVLDSRPNE